ncbi:hypothetical protein C8J56DRAFT_1065604 [Mycena floridula]|nr:hypothetical protein C8J56DRAFT_1065604 [Mycena floridula]
MPKERDKELWLLLLYKKRGRGRKEDEDAEKEQIVIVCRSTTTLQDQPECSGMNERTRRGWTRPRSETVGIKEAALLSFSSTAIIILPPPLSSTTMSSLRQISTSAKLSIRMSNEGRNKGEINGRWTRADDWGDFEEPLLSLAQAEEMGRLVEEPSTKPYSIFPRLASLEHLLTEFTVLSVTVVPDSSRRAGDVHRRLSSDVYEKTE